MWQARRIQQTQQRQGDHRSPFQRDKARILHSAAFRRLQAKTQVWGVGISDFYRTRLTHSLEAAQIGQGIAAQLASKQPDLTDKLMLDHHLIEALCLAHDIGHPPFGHGGEIALHYMMHTHGGFEGNGQTFRIISKLEPYTADGGMNLSRRAVLGLVKYPNFIDTLSAPTPPEISPYKRQIKAADWHPPKGLYRCDEDVFDWLLTPLSVSDKALFCRYHAGKNSKSAAKTEFKSFDCSIMELADDIAYGIHDLEDAIVMGIVQQTDFYQQLAEPLKTMDIGWSASQIDELTTNLFSPKHYQRKDAIGALVNTLITAVKIEVINTDFEQDLLKYNACLPEPYTQALSLFKRFVFNRVIRKPEIQLLEYKGQQLVIELFEAFSSDPERLLPENTRKRWLKAEQQNNGHRIIADYIAGMTDEFASRLYANLFMPKAGNALDHHSQ